jgi:hypothetical protein
MTAASAIGQLLAQSGPELFDRRTMPEQLAALTSLIRQAPAYELRAGEDLHRAPSTLSDLLADLGVLSYAPNHSRAHQPL